MLTFVQENLQEWIRHIECILLNAPNIVAIGADYLGEHYFSNLHQLLFSETSKLV